MSSYANLYNPSVTPQTERARADQVENNAGGFVFALDLSERVQRFLILGSDSNTYYQSARALTRENAKVIEQAWMENPSALAAQIREVSVSGRAPKNDPAIFAVALGTISASDVARKYAYEIVPAVCRTGTHLFQFVSTAKALGKGFGRGMKRAVANWYTSKDVDALAYQVIKYRQREGLTHENLLDMAHPKSGDDAALSQLFEWIVGRLGIDGDVARDAETFPGLIVAHERAMKTTSARELLPILEANPSLPWEALPTWANADVDVQRKLMLTMPMTALIRNLGNLTRIGAIKPMSNEEALIAVKLQTEEFIKKARVHPLTILTALKIYAQGKGMKGGNTWDPSQRIVDALDKAFYKAFQNVEPSGKRTMICLDVSGSMSGGYNGGGIAGSPLSPREASSAMALVTLASEPITHVMGFSSTFMPLRISAGMRIDDVCRYTRGLPFSGTDCSLPMLYALKNGIECDVFAVYTDNETFAGSMHPHQALSMYRQRTGINAKLIVVGMTSTGFTIADPNDAGMLDVVGFDTAAPAVMADFARN